MLIFSLGTSLGLDDMVESLLIAVVAAVVALLLLAAWGRRRFVRKLWESSPPRIRLVRGELGWWRRLEAVRRLADPLRALGFEEVGPFVVGGQSGSKVVGFVKEAECVVATVQQVRRIGIFLNVVTRYADGSRLVHTNCSRIFLPQTHPANRLERMLGASAEEMVRRHVAERPGRPMAAVTAAGFAEYFERSYAEVMDHLNARGRPSDELIRSTWKLRGGRALPDSLAAIARDILARKTVLGLDVGLREQFARVAGLPQEELDRVRDRLVFIHDRMLPDDAVDLFNREVRPSDEAPASEPLSAWPRQAFARLNARLPEGRQYRLLGTLEKPLTADVYVPCDCRCEVRLEPAEEALVGSSLLEVDEDP